MNFSLSHAGSLCKYTGISFVAGAVTHGFFSETRSLATALIGVALYLAGGTLEKMANPRDSQSWGQMLLVGIVASIGLGFFTGGLQHFPDSPERSLWVVPAGFAMSLIATSLLTLGNRLPPRAVRIYGVIGMVLVTAASVYAGHYFEEHSPGHGQHSH
jgi:hypothetical protein